MPTRPPPIARIRLARSWSRLLLVPALLVAAGAAIAVAAFMLIDAPLAYAVAAAGLVPALAGTYLAIRVATMEVDVEEAAVRLRWLGGGRVYALVPGPVTRVRLRGDQASSLRARSRLLGSEVGQATLRDEERIDVVRLAPTRTAILVPTDRGRLAIAAASEPELLDALSRAARARKRLEDLSPAEPSPAEPEAIDGPPSDGVGEQPEPPALEIETPPHILTGIERAMLDERLARERLEAEVAAREEAEVEAAARLEAERVAAELAMVEAARGSESPDTASADAAAMTAVARRLPSVGLVLLPIVASLGVWGAALILERLPEPATESGQLTALALVLAGPATSIAALMARAWWPRLVGVVVTSGLAALVFVGRAVLVS
jgi:hypothetical protein